MRRLLFLLPVALVATIAAWVAVPLLSDRDPQALPSALLNQPVPDFALPPLFDGGPGLSRADLGGEVVLVNVFASWCAPCIVEHPVLTELARSGVPIHAMAYKDEPSASRAFLERLGNPFTRIGVDRDGRTAIDWGVYGVPETFVVDAEGRIRYRYAGALSSERVEREIRPLVERLRAEAGS